MLEQLDKWDSKESGHTDQRLECVTLIQHTSNGCPQKMDGKNTLATKMCPAKRSKVVRRTISNRNHIAIVEVLDMIGY